MTELAPNLTPGADPYSAAIHGSLNRPTYPTPIIKNILPSLAFLLGAVAAQAQVIVTAEDWQFNTLGDTEGWTSSQVNDLDVRAAISGSETVLSGAISAAAT